jgi:hypothetical protein
MSEVPTAFPWTHDNVTCTGMTLRDYFAARALQCWVAGTDHTRPFDYSRVVSSAYEIADAMMKAREA